MCTEVESTYEFGRVQVGRVSRQTWQTCNGEDGLVTAKSPFEGKGCNCIYSPCQLLRSNDLYRGHQLGSGDSSSSRNNVHINERRHAPSFPRLPSPKRRPVTCIHRTGVTACSTRTHLAPGVGSPISIVQSRHHPLSFSPSIPSTSNDFAHLE